MTGMVGNSFSRALWFGPCDRPLFGRLYIPVDGQARGAVLLCPPFDLEAQEVALAYRLLAEDLQRRRFAVLHLNYDGTGDSAGATDDPERVPAWQTSIVEAVSVLRSGGAGHVSLVAMRFGATLAASVAARSGTDGLVLWDPCPSGRTYLREQALLRSVHEVDQGLQPSSELGEGPGHVETLGSTYHPVTVAQMSALTIQSLPVPLAPSVLALMRPERPLRGSFLERLSKENVEFGVASGQDDLLSAWTVRSVVPWNTMASIVAWLERVAPLAAHPLHVAGRATARLNTPGRKAMVERVQVTQDRGLFMILTEPEAATSARTIVLLNVGRTDHTGPGRLWVDLARSWADMGLRVVRADVSGLGGSPARPGREVDRAYPAEVVEDVRDIVESVSRGSTADVVLVGLCSGGYHAAIAALEMPVRGVVAINPGLPGEVGSEPKNQAVTPSETLPPGAHRPGTSRWLLVKAHGKAWFRRHLPGYGVLRVPARAAREMKWWFLNRIGSGRRPALLFKQLARSGTNTVVILRPCEAELFGRGARGMLRRLCRRGGFRIEVVDGSDHTLYMPCSRRKVVPILTGHVLALVGWPRSMGRRPENEDGGAVAAAELVEP